MSFCRTIIASGCVFAAVSTSNVEAQDYYQSEALSRDSAYETNGNAFFLRGGYAFADTEEFSDPSSFYSSIGLRQKLHRIGDSMFSLEGEFLAAREEEDFLILGTPIEVRVWELVPNAALRWQYNFDGRLAPYVSVGVGPAITLASVESGGVVVSDSSVDFAYTGRAGVELSVTPKFGLEAGYRFLGISDDIAVGFHAAEIGLNFKF